MDGNNNSSIWVAVSILIAGVLIGGAVFFTRDSGGDSSNALMVQYNNFMRTTNAKFASIRTNAQTADITTIRPPNASDYILGSLDSPIIIVEYSDTECPFCSVLHDNLKEVIEIYDGKVSWVYRHLPLVSLHRKAVIEAHALECAGSVGGNQKFWDYTNILYEMTNGNDGLDLNQLPVIAEMVGLNVSEFNLCMSEERHVADIEEDYREILDATAGQVGTPYNVIFTANGDRLVASGALPVANWISIIDQILSQLEQSAE
ncbi:MAG TPA: thioredoxin domain-containing protein [Candidatus Paceibacterota bacterium]|nr:thioredoxin domain-containing protein [Candidatus Paceibacterota bacterium]